MKKKIFIILMMGVLVILLAGCGNAEPKTKAAQKRILKSRYGFNTVKTIDYQGPHTENHSSGINPFDVAKVEYPAFGRYQCDGKVVCVRADKDDYYYDELVAGVNAYYRRMFGTDELFVSTSSDILNCRYTSNVYANFFKNNDIDSMDDEIILKFIQEYATKVTVIIAKSIYESDETAIRRIEEILDGHTDNIVEVQLMNDLSGIEEYRQPSNPALLNFDDYVIDNVDLNKRIKCVKGDGSL